jgi:hypothetical protein
MTSLKEKITGIPQKLKSCLAVLFSLLIASTFAFDPNEDLPVYKKTWNSSQYKQEDNTVTAKYQPGWLHYLDSNKEWQDIDSTFVKNGQFYEMSKAPFTAKVPLLSTGTATFISNNRWDNIQNKEIPDASLNMNLTAQGVAEVQAKIETGDFGFGETEYVVYPNAYPSIKGDLIYWVHPFPSPELKKIIRINQNPNVGQDVKLCFNTGFNKAVDLQEDNVPKEGKIITEDPVEITPDSKDGPRKIVLEKAYIWHKWKETIEEDKLIPSDREEVTVEVDGSSLCKILPKESLDALDYPVYSDATLGFSPSSDAADGYTYWADLSGQTWATARAAAAVTYNNIGDYMFAGIYSNSATNEWENFWRAKIILDTSSIDDAAVIHSTQLAYNQAGGPNWFGDKIVISQATTASNTQVTGVDHPVANCTTTPFTDGVDMASGSYLENFNATGVAAVSKTGYTKLCLNSKFDLLNTEPTWFDGRGSYAYIETGNLGNLILTVNYGPILSPKKIMPLL